MSVDRLELFAAESWPGGRAPAEWWVEPNGDGTYAVHASLWVPNLPALTGGTSLGCLWWVYRTGVSIDHARGLAIAEARELERARDAALYAIPSEAWRFGARRASPSER